MKQLSNINTNELTGLLIPAFEHKEPVGDDCGLPENPIFSNYSKYLWTGHSRNPRIRSLARARENTDEHNHIK